MVEKKDINETSVEKGTETSGVEGLREEFSKLTKNACNASGDSTPLVQLVNAYPEMLEKDPKAAETAVKDFSRHLQENPEKSKEIRKWIDQMDSTEFYMAVLKTGVEVGDIDSQISLASMQRREGNLDEAQENISAVTEPQDGKEAPADKKGWALYEEAYVADLSGDKKKAEDLFEQSVEAEKAVNNEDGEYMSETQLRFVRYDQNPSKENRAKLKKFLEEEALPVFEATGNKRWQMNVYNRLSELALEDNDPDLADDYLHNVIPESEKSNEHLNRPEFAGQAFAGAVIERGQARIALTKARIALREEDEDLAARLYEEAAMHYESYLPLGDDSVKLPPAMRENTIRDYQDAAEAFANIGDDAKKDAADEQKIALTK